MRRGLIKYFIPHESNEYKPHMLRQEAVAAILVSLFVIFVFTTIQSVVITDSGLLSQVVPRVLVDLANEERHDANVRTLKINPLLQDAAQRKANDMAAKGYFAHYSPDGVSPWYWFKEAGYNFKYAGENLAIHFVDSADVNEAWMNSPGHRKNILNRNFTEIGIATAKGTYNGFETTFVVQMFGTPSRVAVVGGAGVVFASDNALEDISQTETFASTAWERLITKPRSVAGTLYLVLGALVAVALVLMVCIEIRKQHALHIAYGLLLIIVIFSAFYVSGELFTQGLSVL